MKKIVIGVWILLIVGMFASGFVSYYRYSVMHNFLVLADIDCDPSQHSCFSGDGDSAPESYKEVSKPAQDIPSCNEWADECPPLICTKNDSSCTETFCDPTSEDDCVTPEQGQ